MLKISKLYGWSTLTELKITDATTSLFYQNVSQELFETLISQKCLINDHGISTEYIQHMTLDEENAVQYVAGFVIRVAKDKLKFLMIKRSSTF